MTQHSDMPPASRVCPHSVDAWAQLLRASQRLLREVEHDLKEKGFPPLQWYDVLRELAEADGNRLRQFELEERVALAQYNLSRLIDRLEARGLVRREGCPSDRRGNFVIAAPEGLALKAEMWPVYEQAIARHFGKAVFGAEAATLAGLLRPLAEAEPR